jgi:dihydrodipicolinate synthase/N-acetylneuraminate lyase
VTLAAHAAEVGADAVVVIGPPYFKLDEKAQYAHFFAAATACAPVPFYVYEFASTTGYAIAPAVLERLRHDAPNVVGLKVSDTPFEAFENYLLPGFDIFVGPEALIADGMGHGALGAVSALASALPGEVAAVVRAPTPEGAARLGELRSFVERFPRQAALKRLLALQGVPVKEDVRAPLRALTFEERDELDAWAEGVVTYAESNSS